MDRASFHIEPERVISLNRRAPAVGGPVLYWMEREQRLDDNDGLIFALEQAVEAESYLIIVYILSARLISPTLRNIDFILGGLSELKQRAEALGIPFLFYTCPGSAFAEPASAESGLSQSLPADLLISAAAEHKASALVCDFNPLRESLQIKEEVAQRINIPVYEVDSHNIIPCRYVSDKQEYGAHTLRRKIEKRLPRFLKPYPGFEVALEAPLEAAVKAVPALQGRNIRPKPSALPGPAEAAAVVGADLSVKPLTSVQPGYGSGMQLLETFIESGLEIYAADRNDPTKDAQSGLSPFLHFGQISARTAAYLAAETLGFADLKGGFLDELIVRRELSDNFCLYNQGYDSSAGFPAWAAHSLVLHSADRRDYVYKTEEFESASTHDRLWNAAQNQLLFSGRIHGYMRMYWAKKILEWSSTAEAAMSTAVYLNDKYSIDGKDPNGYAGCAWAVGGVHDRAWTERSVFGKIRYMNERGCRRKFDVDEYIRQNAGQ